MIEHTRVVLAALALTLVPGALQAHEGHGPEATWASLVHWLSSPFHVALVVMLAAMLGAAVWFGRQALREPEGEAPVTDPGT